MSLAFRVDPWDPAYGSSTDDLTASGAEVVTAVELPEDRWAPLGPAPVDPPSAVLFADGVTRLDARVWFDPTAPDGVPEPGVCASQAGGVVCSCAAGAHVTAVQVRRVVAGTRDDLSDISTRAGDYTAHPVSRVSGTDSGQLVMRAVQARLAALEVDVVQAARHPGSGAHGAPDDLIVVDGPLRTHSTVPRAVGFIKAHHAAYLPERLNQVVTALGPGQRTPVFGLGTQWHRFSWYLRLPGRATGVVRLEAAPDLDVDEVRHLADQTVRVLPRYASTEYKDARAPQNLYPVGGLEKALRRRLGDSALLHRALRAAGTPAGEETFGAT